MIVRFMLVLALCVAGTNALSDENEDSRKAGLELQAQSKEKIFLALQKLAEANEIFRSLKPKVEYIESVRADYKDNALPTDAELQKMKRRIEQRLESLTGSEPHTCTLAELNGGGDCKKKINHNDRISINEDIRRHNEIHHQNTPKLDRWNDATSAASKIFNMAQKAAHKSLEELGRACQDYWDGTVLVSLSAGKEDIEGFVSFPLKLENEDKIKKILKDRCEGYKINIWGIEKGLEDMIEVWRKYDSHRPGELVNTIDLITGYVHSISAFGINTSEASLDSAGLFYELLKYNKEVL